MYRVEGPEDGGVPPGKPNFKLIVILFGVAILAVLGIAFLVLPGFVHKNPVHPDNHPNSSIVMPQRDWTA